jgi:hypothetical protein
MPVGSVLDDMYVHVNIHSMMYWVSANVDHVWWWWLLLLLMMMMMMFRIFGVPSLLCRNTIRRIWSNDPRKSSVVVDRVGYRNNDGEYR